MKPVALVADALIDCSARGDVVLDQFAGSGTTILAAEKVGRIGFGMEYEPAYVDVAVKRWQRMTKLDATLEGDVTTFDEIAASRAAVSRRAPVRQPTAAEMTDSAPSRFLRVGAMAKRNSGKLGDHTVGYGRPPKSTQYVEGRSGNPRGRPKGSKGVGEIFRDLFHQKISETENGKTRKMLALVVMLRRLQNDAMRGDAKALKLFLSLADRYLSVMETAHESGSLPAEDEAILSQYIGTCASHSKRRRRRVSTTMMRTNGKDRAFQALLRRDFRAFVHKAFLTLSPGQTLVRDWHQSATAYQLERVRRGEIKRLIINMPRARSNRLWPRCPSQRSCLGVD